MLKISVTDGVATLRLAANLESFEGAKAARMHRRIGAALRSRILAGFEAEHSPEGAAWEPLKPATIRSRKGDAHPILRRSGRLARSITSRPDAQGVLVGTNLVYAAAHQFGAQIERAAGAVKLHFRRVKRGKNKGRTLFAREDKASFGMAAKAHTIRIPARPYLFQRDGGIPADWQQAVLAIVQRYLGVKDHA